MTSEGKFLHALQAEPEWGIALLDERTEDTPTANARRGEAAALYGISRVEVEEVVREFGIWLEGRSSVERYEQRATNERLEDMRIKGGIY